MNITIIARHVTVHDDLKELVEKKLAKFDRYFPKGADAAVTFRRVRDNECMEIEGTWLQLRLKENFRYKTSDEDCAALLMEFPDWFSPSNSRVGSFDSEKLGLHFSIYNANDSRSPDYVLGIGYKLSNVKLENISELVCKLYDLQIIEDVS